MSPSPSPQELQRLLTEARAKVTWGSRTAEVRTWLLSRGVDAEVADQALAEAASEAQDEARRRALRDLAVGGPLLLGGALVLVLWPADASFWGNMVGLIPGAFGLVFAVRAFNGYLASRDER